MLILNYFKKSLFLNNVAGLMSAKTSPAKVFSCQFYEIFKNTFFKEYFQTTALNRLDGQKI